MKFKYLTSKRYPSTTADHFFVRHMAEAFTKILGNEFCLFVSGDISEELNKVNVAYVKAPKHLRSLFYFFWIPITVIKRKENNETTIYFSNDPILLSILIFWKKIFYFRYKICSDWHQLFRDWRDKYISRNSNFLITTSNTLKNLIVDSFSVSGEKIEVAYGGVNLDDSKNISNLRDALGFSDSDLLVGYVGFYKTMGMSKGLDTMISALALIPDTKVKMVFVGGKSVEIAEYRVQAEALGVSERVLFVAMVPNNQVLSYESMLDVLVIPYPNQSHFRDFGFPMKVYEYMASGKPIIYSNLEIINEVLKDCAISFQTGDSSDLSKKINMILSNKTLAEKMTLQAHQDVQNYSWEKRADKIKIFLESTF